MFCSSCGDIAFYTAHELSTVTFDSFLSVLSFLACIVTNIIAAFVFWLNIYINLKFKTEAKKMIPGRTTIGMEKLKEKWIRFNVFFLEFKNSFFLQQVFTAVFVLRSYVINLCVAIFNRYPILQTVIMTTSSLLMLFYLLIKSPMKKSIINIQQTFCEVVLLIVNGGIFVLSVMDALEIEDIPKRQMIGNAILMVNLVMSYAMSAFLVAKVALIAREHYLARKMAKKVMPQGMKQNTSNIADANHTVIPLKKPRVPQRMSRRKRVNKTKKLERPVDNILELSIQPTTLDNSMTSLKTLNRGLTKK